MKKITLLLIIILGSFMVQAGVSEHTISSDSRYIYDEIHYFKDEITVTAYAKISGYSDYDFNLDTKSHEIEEKNGSKTLIKTFDITKLVSSKVKYRHLVGSGTTTKSTLTLQITKDPNAPTLIDPVWNVYEDKIYVHLRTYDGPEDLDTEERKKHSGIKSFTYSINGSTALPVNLNTAELEEYKFFRDEGVIELDKSDFVDEEIIIDIEVLDNVENRTTKQLIIDLDEIAPLTFHINTNHTTFTNADEIIITTDLKQQDHYSNFASINSGKTMYSFDAVKWTVLNDSGLNPHYTLTVKENTPVYFRFVDNFGRVNVENIYIKHFDRHPPEINYHYDSAPSKENLGLSFISVDEETDLYPSSDIKDKSYCITPNKINSDNNTLFTSLNGSKITIEENSYVYLKSEDNAGNIITEVIEITNIDKVDPILTISPNTQDWVSDRVTLNILANDSSGSGIGKTLYYIGGKNLDQGITVTENWNELVSGNQIDITENGYIYCITYDKAGNTSPIISYEVDNIDKTKPLFNPITYNTSLTNESIMMTPIAFDNESGISGSISYSIDGATPSDLLNGMVTITSNGTIQFFVTNNSGLNTSSELIQITNIDNVSPEVTITTDPLVGDYTSEEVNVTLNKIDNISKSSSIKASYSYNGVTTSIGTKSSFRIDRNGTYSVTVYDEAGNSAYIDFIINNIDTTPPTINLKKKSPELLTNSSVTLTFTVIDNESGVKTFQYKDIDGTWQSVNNSSIEISSNGVYTFRARNNTDLSSSDTPTTAPERWSTLDINIDNIDRDKPLITGSPLSSNNPHIKEILSMKDLDSIVVDNSTVSAQYSFDKKNWYNYKNNIPLSTLTDGIKYIYIKVTDEAGNQTVSSGYKFTKDNTSPVIESFKMNFNNNREDTEANSSIEISSLNIIESNLNSYGYSIIDSVDRVVLHNSFESDVTAPISIDINSLPEGSYTFRFYVKDRATNTGYLEKEFHIDRTSPIASTITLDLQRDLTLLKDDSIISDNNLDINFITSDNHIDNPRYLFCVTQKTPIQMDSYASFELYNQDTSFVFDEGNGLYYVYCKLIDDAGNLSNDYYYRTIRYNNRHIPIPLVSGVKKALDVKDTINTNSPLFFVSPRLYDISSNPIDYSNMEITGYQYMLYKGVHTTTESAYIEGFISSNTVGITQLSFNSLEENEENEYYTLYIAAKSSTGKYSLYTNGYKFRIDTKPPKNLTVYSSTHTDLDSKYSYDTVQYFWQKPLDMTGVKEYLYYTSIDGVHFTKGDSGKIIEEGEIQKLNLSLPGDYIYGDFYLKVIALDFGDNQEEYIHKIKIDKTIPQLSITNIVNDFQSLSTTVYWTVEGSIRNQSISITKGDYIVETILTADTSSFTFNGLKADYQYNFKIAVYSNSVTPIISQVSKDFRVDDKSNTLIEPETIDFINQFSGFRVDGSYNISHPEQSDIKLYIPQNMSITTAGRLLNTVKLTSTGFDETTDILRSGETLLKDATITIKETNFLTSNDTTVSYYYQNGVSFNKLLYCFPLNSTESRDIKFESININSALMSEVSGLATLNEDFRYQSCSYMDEYWIVDNVNKVLYENDYIVLQHGNIDFSNYYNYKTLEEDTIFNLQNIKLGKNREILSATINDIGIIEIGDINTTSIIVNSARIVKDEFIIDDGEIIFDSNAISKINITDLRLDISGNITSQPILTEPIIVERDNVTFKINSIKFDSTGLNSSGEILYNNRVIEDSAFSDFYLTNSGYNVSSRGNYNSNITFNTNSGYTVHATSEHIYVTTMGLLLEKATIDLSPFKSDCVAPISGLLIDYNLKDIIEPGLSPNSEVVEISDVIYLREWELSNNNLVAKVIDYRLPVDFATEFIRINDSIMSLGDNGRGSFLQGTIDNSSKELILDNNFPLTLMDGRFENSSIYIDNASLELPKCCDISVIPLTEVIITEDDFTYSGFPNHIEFIDSGLTLNIFNPVLDERGLTGETNLEISISGISQKIYLDDFVLYSDGTYDLPKTDIKTSYLRLGTYDALVSGITLIRDSSVPYLHIDKTLIQNRAKTIIIPIEDLILSSSGEIIDYGFISGLENFTSSNGFYVDVNKSTFTGEKILLSGSIRLPKTLGDYKTITFEDTDIELTSDWVILTPQNTASELVTINGVEVEISNYSIYEDGLFIESSNIQMEEGKNFNIFNTVLDSSGNYISHGYLDPSVSKLNISGWNFDVISAGIYDRGITLKSLISLPEELGGSYILFDDLILYQEGSDINYTSNTVINHLNFTHRDMDFSFKKIRVNPEFTSINSAAITLPDNEIFEGETISIKYFRIGSDGSFRLNGSKIDPINIKGLDVYIENFSMVSNRLDISGSVVFPYDFGISELAGREFSIKELNYNFNTGKTVFDIELDRIVVKISDDWTTEFSELSVSSSGLSIGQGTLFFPDDWLDNISIDNTTFTNLTYSFHSKEFDIEQIDINNVIVNCEGYEFTITNANYSSEGFTLAGEFPLNGLFKGEIQNPKIEVKKLQISDDFRITELSAGLSANDLSLTNERELLYSGYIGVSAMDNRFMLDLEGVLKPGSNFALEGFSSEDELTINSFTYDILHTEIVELDAIFETPSKHLFDLDINDIRLGITYRSTSDVMEFTLGGETLIHDSFPGVGGELFIVFGKFDTTGSVKEFYSGITISEDKELIGDITIEKGSNITLLPITETVDSGVKLKALEFSFNDTSLLFSDNFSVESLRGGEIDVHSLALNTQKGFDRCNLTVTTPQNMKIFEDVILKDGSISLNTDSGSDLITSISGTLQLSDNLGGIEVTINQLQISSGGEIVVDAGANITSVTIFDQLELYNGIISIRNSSARGGLDFNIGGDFQLLSETLPNEIRKSALYGNILYSTHSGVENFSVGMVSGSTIDYVITDGVQLSLDKLTVSQDGFSSRVTLEIERGFFGLKSNSSTAGEIFMNWGGEIISSDIVVRTIGFEFADMALDVTNLRVNEQGVNFETAVIQLPNSLGRKKIGITNAGITNDGKLYGALAIPVLTVDILGCSVSLYSPRLDFENRQLACSRADFTLPDALGSASVGLDDVTISSRGLNISGGEFTLPDIKTGAMNFTRMKAALSIDGDQYRIAAEGRVFIAGTGELDAEIALVNISNPDYPIGLEYASFSFEAKTGGIPLATTGLFMTGIRGGLAFGPPGEDLPEYYRDKFSNGMRIELGVTINDTNRSIEGRTDLWINVTNFEFALKGEVDFVNGLFTAWAQAIYTQSYGLEVSAGANFDIISKIYVEGLIRAHIFEQNNKSRFCAEARVSVAVQDLLFGLPSSPYNIGTVGIEVGDFKDEKKGIKGYVKVPVLGTKGLYFGSNGEFKVGNVNRYVLLDKVSSSRSMYSETLFATKTKRYTAIRTEPTYTNRGITELPTRDRIIFNVEFTEGDPHITLISPSGLEYQIGNDSIEYARLDDQIVIAVINPENGNWDIEVSNLSVDADFNVEAVDFGKNPTITATTPTYNKETTNLNYSVTGTYESYTDKEVQISVYLSRERGTHNGFEVATIRPDSYGTYSVDISTNELDNGEYFVYTGMYDGINPELYSYAKGSIVVDNSMDIMPTIDDLVVAYNSDRVLDISFSNSSGNKAKGFNLNIINRETGESETLNLGYITKTNLSSLSASSSYALSVTPYDNMGNLGEESNIVEVDYSYYEEVENRFRLVAEPIYINIGELQESNLVVIPIEFQETGNSLDYTELELIDTPDFLLFNPYTNRVKLDSENSFDFQLKCSEFYNGELTKPGLYSITVKVNSIGNENIYETITIPVNVEFPKPEIVTLFPEEWHILDSESIEIRGSGFTSSSVVSIGGVECTVTEQSSNTLHITTPKLTESNSQQLKISNSETIYAEKELNLQKPGYSLNHMKQKTVIPKGGSGWLYTQIEANNRFDSSVDFELISQPESFTLEASNTIHHRELYKIRVDVPMEVDNGTYYIESQSGDTITTYTVMVVDEIINPVIQKLSSHSGNWGDEITIYGYGFNKNSTLNFNNTEHNIIQEEDYIKFTIPVNSINGFIRVVDGSTESNSAELHINDDNFNIYSSADNLILKAGDSVTEDIYIRGYAKYVDLKIINENHGIDVTLLDNHIVPNGSTKLTIDLDSTVEEGLYTITLVGRGEYYTKELPITISVGKNIEIGQTELMEGKIDREYSDFIKVINDRESYTFSLVPETYLPHGLNLNSETGEIYGTPTDAGTYSFIINVFESHLRQNNRELTITITDSGWFSIDGPDGNNRFSSINSPAEENIKWTSKTYSNESYTLSSGDYIYVISPNSLEALNRDTGRRSFIITDSFSTVTIESSYLINSEDESITFYNKKSGEKLHTISGVTDYRLVNNQLIYNKNNSTYLLNLGIWDSGEVIEDIDFTNSFITTNGLYKVNETKLYQLIDYRFEDVKNLETKPHFVTTFDNELFHIDQFGTLKSDNRVIETGINSPKLVVNSDYIIVYNSYELVIINRATYSKIYRSISIDELILTNDMFTIINSEVLTTFNIYSGNEIWTKAGSFRGLITSGKYLNVIDSENRVVCFGGRNNIEAPETKLIISPAIPNGDNGYYSVNPTIALITTDRESYGLAEYSIDNREWMSYNELLTMDDGEYDFRYLSYDSLGLSEKLKTLDLKIDTVKPVTKVSYRKTDGDSSYITSPLYFTLSSTDETSGIDKTYYSINGEEEIYSSEVNISEEGEYTIDWWSRDRAGNRENRNSEILYIDLYTPTIDSEIYNDTESSTIYLTATDSFSGIEKMEYRINGAEPVTYIDPITLPIGGLYNVTFRSIDRAGLHSEWKDIVLDLSNIEPVNLIQDLSYSWGNSSRYIDRDVQVGDKLYSDRNRYIQYLPDYLAGGEMIVGKFSDKYSWVNKFIEFKAGLKIDLYLIKHQDSNTRLDDTWLLVDQNVAISDEYYEGGADVYHRVVEKDEYVSIMGAAIWKKGGPNLIIAKRNLEADLNIFSPNPSKTLTPLSRYWFSATNIDGQQNRHWYYNLNGEEVDLGTNFSGEFTLPYIHEDTTLELIVEVEATNPVDPDRTDIIRSTRTYDVINQGRVELLEPVSGSQVLLNSETDLDYRVYNYDGNITETTPNWSTDNGFIYNNRLKPQSTGLTTVTSLYNIYEDYTKTNSTTLNIVESYTTEIFDFGTKLYLPFMEQENGRDYGFNKDNRHRVGEITYVDIPEGKYWSNDKITKEYIVLEENDTFEYLVNNGTYRVKVLTGGLNHKESNYIDIENSPIDITVDKKTPLYTIETTVEVIDNKLTIKGSEGLKLIELEVERVEIPIESSVTPIESTKLIRDQKWYEWNPDHYFPDLDWYNTGKQKNRYNKEGRE